MAIIARQRRGQMFLLGLSMVLLHLFVDLVTTEYPIPFFLPFLHTGYTIPYLLSIPAQNQDTWFFIFKVVVQWTFKVALFSGTVFIYIKFRRTFIELISSNLDRFLTDFAILPFQKKCDIPDCKNRAHYRCKDTESVRCIRHSKINRDLTISCNGA